MSFPNQNQFTNSRSDLQRWWIFNAVAGFVSDIISGIINVVTSGTTVLPSASFVRPANTTAYTSGDLVANSTTAGSVVPISLTIARIAGGSGMIRKVRIRKTGTSITNASFRVHFYRTIPTVTNGDNGVFLSTQSTNYMGAFDVNIDTAFSDGAAGNGAPRVGSEINFKLPSGQVAFALIEARGAYTPASGETFTLEAEVLQN